MLGFGSLGSFISFIKADPLQTLSSELLLIRLFLLL